MQKFARLTSKLVAPIALATAFGCASRTDVSREEQQRPCDPRGAERIPEDQLDARVAAVSDRFTGLTWQLAECDAPVGPFDGELDKLAEQCREAAASSDCAWTCVAESIDQQVRQRAHLARVALEHLPGTRGCALVADAASCVLESLGQQSVPGVRLHVATNPEGELAMATAVAEFPLGQSLEMGGRFESGGCGTGPVWSTFLR